jgi:hypothetical protein
MNSAVLAGPCLVMKKPREQTQLTIAPDPGN